MGSAHERILVLDFGSQYTQLIARRIREAHVYSEILPYNVPLARILERRPAGLILSGGPASVYDRKAPSIPAPLLEAGIPLLGICYGMQLVTQVLGGKVARAAHREYGPATLQVDDTTDLFKGFEGERAHPTVWMSHGDRIEEMPPGFRSIARTPNSPVAAMKATSPGRRIYCLQFHPEVAHTEGGTAILKNFVYDICGLKPDWTMRSFMTDAMTAIRDQVRTGRVFCALSGGVDSSVAAVLTHRAVGDRLTCLFVDHGLLREVFKDEVRELGRELGLPDEIIWRQPFPGPGLAIRILGPVTQERLATVRAADAIVEQEIRKAGYYRKIWQAFAVLLPVRTVGVMGDQRTYENVVAVRAVSRVDGMTADWARLPDEVLASMSTRIINEVKGVNRVVFDISSKPPSTIEWE